MEAELRLRRVAGRLADFRPLFRDALDDLVTQMEVEQFRSSGALGRLPWAPLTAVTEARKRRQGVLGRGTLRFSDRLYRSVTERAHPDREVTLTATGYTVRTLVPYAPYHQFGAPARNLPIRQVYPDPVPSAWLDRMRAIVRAYLRDRASDR